MLCVTSLDIELQSNHSASDTAAVFVPHMGNGRFGRSSILGLDSRGLFFVQSPKRMPALH
jgi:hypothetical protein